MARAPVKTDIRDQQGGPRYPGQRNIVATRVCFMKTTDHLKLLSNPPSCFLKEYLMNSIEVPVLSNRDEQNNGSLSTSPLFDVTTVQPS